MAIVTVAVGIHIALDPWREDRVGLCPKKPREMESNGGKSEQESKIGTRC